MTRTREKILVIGKYYPPFNGGIELVTRQYAERLSQFYDVDVLVSAHDGERGARDMDGVRVIRVGTQVTLFSQPLSFGMLSKIRLRDYAGVQFHAPNPFVASILWAKMALDGFRTPLMIVHHMEISGRKALWTVLGPVYRHLARRAAWVSVTSPKNHAISQDLPRDARVVTLPLFVDRAAYPDDAEFQADAMRWRQQKYGQVPLIGFIGRHAHYKGLDVLIRALVKLPEARAVIAGEGAFRARTMQLAQELGVADRVEFPGGLSHHEKCRLLAAIDVFAFPSTGQTEAFGLSQLEAMLLGAVVVATDLPTGVTDVSVHEETALLAQPGDADHLAEQIARVLSDKELHTRLRSAAALHVEERFSRERVLAELERLTRTAIGAPEPV